MNRPELGFGQRDPLADARRYGARRNTRTRGRAATIATLAAIVLLTAWASAATLYIVFRDDALKLLAKRQVAIARSHDSKVVELQAEIVRLKSLKLIDQERIERTVAELAQRQSELERRQATLATLATPPDDKSESGGGEITGSLPAAGPPPPAPAPKPSPLSNTILIVPPSQQWAQLESRPLRPLAPRVEAARPATAIEVRLTNLAREQRRLEQAQNAALIELEERHDGRRRRMHKIFAQLGLAPPRRADKQVAMANAGSGSGGPYLPWTQAPDDPFARQLHRIHTAREAADIMQAALAAVPVRRPIVNSSAVTSPFGMRVDPFLGQLALHTGVDFLASTGDPVYAAAAGQVSHAGRNGGYGIMVEIDHGNGIVTRYAHLSAARVEAGAPVAAGALIGHAGSTGRSTGPHLHYEVRIGGEAVDPQKFLRAGLRLDEPL